MCSSAWLPPARQVAAAMFTPASLIAAATSASAPGVFSMSMTRSTAIGPRRASLLADVGGYPLREPLGEHDRRDVRECRRAVGHDRGVDDAEPLRTVDAA